MFEPSSVQNVVVILSQPLALALCAWLTVLKRQRRVFVCLTSARDLRFPGGASKV
jgi:hypothetical protein